MVPMNDEKFLNDLFGFLDYLIDSGHEVHIEDRSDPDHIVEHVFNADEADVCVDIDVDADVEIEIDDDGLPFDEECPDESWECDNCKCFDECFADEIYHDPEYVPPMWGIPDIDRVVFSGPATIVFWDDGTKTVVKAMKGEKVEHYAGFAAACMKKMFGSTSRAKAIMNECAVEEIPKPNKHKHEGKTPCECDEDVIMTEEQQTAHDVAVQEAIDEALG